MNKAVSRMSFVVTIVLVVTWLCCGSSEPMTTKPTTTTRNGWLCDYDLRGEVALWSKPNQPFQNGNEIADVVPLIAGDCIPVHNTREQYTDGIIYYYVTVDEKKGWVDVDYFYFKKSDFDR